jgi:translation initiation factor IF-2
VFDGKVANGAQFRLIRDDEILSQWKVTSLQREQQSVSEVAEWYECGMKVTVGKKIIEGDRLEFFVME